MQPALRDLADAISSNTGGVSANTASIVALSALLATLQPVGFATVLSDGSVVAANSSGVTSANVTLELGSSYCFKDLPFSFSMVQATPLYVVDIQADVTTMVEFPDVGSGTIDCTSTDTTLEISTTEDSAFAPHGFTVVFYRQF